MVKKIKIAKLYKSLHIMMTWYNISMSLKFQTCFAQTETTTEEITTMSSTTSEVATTTTNTNTTSMVTLTYVWYTYSLDEEVHEAPLAVPIGGTMLALLLVFLLLLCLLDCDSYVRNIRKACKNCGGKRRRRREREDQMEREGRSYSGVASGYSGTRLAFVDLEHMDSSEKSTGV